MRRLAEGGSRFFQFALYGSYERVPATEHASCDAFRFLKRRHGLAEIVERGASGIHERDRIIPSHPERVIMRRPENASRHRQRFAHQ